MTRTKFINAGFIFAITILMTIYLGKATTQKIHRMSCRNEATFKASGAGFIVKASSSKLISTVNTPLLPHCARTCIKTESCKSLVYKKKPANPAEKNCQLLNVEKSSLTNTDIENSIGWSYFEPLQQGTSRCQPTACQLGYECTETCNPSVANYYTCNEINECNSSPCLNGASCIDKVNSYTCACRSGYVGPRCSLTYISSITSPSYPSSYSNSISKTWSLSVPRGKLILYFYDFETESCCDEVQLRDGSSSSSSLIATVSGSNGKYQNYIASGRYMYVKFYTDGSATRKGFKANIGSI